ncbi:hypothetical protein D3C72_1709550 [compost metagenome]
MSYNDNVVFLIDPFIFYGNITTGMVTRSTNSFDTLSCNLFHLTPDLEAKIIKDEHMLILNLNTRKLKSIDNQQLWIFKIENQLI